MTQRGFLFFLKGSCLNTARSLTCLTCPPRRWPRPIESSASQTYPSYALLRCKLIAELPDRLSRLSSTGHGGSGGVLPQCLRPVTRKKSRISNARVSGSRHASQGGHASQILIFPAAATHRGVKPLGHLSRRGTTALPHRLFPSYSIYGPERATSLVISSSSGHTRWSCAFSPPHPRSIKSLTEELLAVMDSSSDQAGFVRRRKDS